MSRRSVVRAGAVAAWSIPLVQLATAAPALAASPTGKLDSTMTSAVRATKTLTTVGNVHNNNSVLTTTSLQCLLQVFTNGSTQAAATVPTLVGWTLGTRTAYTESGQTANQAVQWLCTATGQVGPDGNRAFSPTITLQNAAAGKVRITATSSNVATGVVGLVTFA